MIEVTLALGIIAFSLIAILGLLPTGLRTQQDSQEEARAASALNMVMSAAESLRPAGSTGGNASWAFPNYFSDNPDPSANPTRVSVSQSPWNFTFFISEGGLIIPNNDTTTTRRQTLYVHVYPPQVEGQPVRIYAAVAWPYRPSDTSGTSGTSPSDMAGRQGFLDTVIAYTPKVTY
jgi:type II secretory pathway pseudopilin PulG